MQPTKKQSRNIEGMSKHYLEYCRACKKSGFTLTYEFDERGTLMVLSFSRKEEEEEKK